MRPSERSSGKPYQAVFQASACWAVRRSMRSPLDAMRIGIRPGSRPGRGGGGQQDRVVDVVEAPVERHPLAADERQDDLERLLEPPDAMVERVAEGGVLRLVPARAEAEDQAAVRDLVDRRGHLRGERGRPEPGAQDDRAELRPLGRGGDGGEQRGRLVEARPRPRPGTGR